MYTELEIRLMKVWNGEEVSSDMLSYVKDYIQSVKERMKKTFDEHCELGLYTLKFPL